MKLRHFVPWLCTKKYLSCQAAFFKTVYVLRSVCSLTDLPHSIWVDDSSHHHCQLHCPGSGTTFARWGQDTTVWTPGKLKRYDALCDPYVNMTKSGWQFWLLIIWFYLSGDACSYSTKRPSRCNQILSHLYMATLKLLPTKSWHTFMKMLLLNPNSSSYRYLSHFGFLSFFHPS